MVLFSENLKLAKKQLPDSWHDKYLAYDALKAQIAKISQLGKAEVRKPSSVGGGLAAKITEASDAFLVDISAQLKEINSLVVVQTEKAEATYKKLVGTEAVVLGAKWTAQLEATGDKTIEGAVVQLEESQLSSSVLSFCKSLRDLSALVANMKSFVGTNVVAATKIVKKHDKNAPNDLKREAVSDLIKAQPFYAAPTLPALTDKVHALTEAALGKIYGGEPVEGGAVKLQCASQSDEDEETETTELMGWLLQTADPESSKTSVEIGGGETQRFIETYMADWSLTRTAKASGSDPWEVDFTDDAKLWSEKDCGERGMSILITTTKLVLAFAALFLFICSLSFLADGFRLVAGKKAGEVFQNSEVFNNPVAGVMVGVLVTVLVQSSSTSTSICITMVGADLLTVKQAIPIIMGANIGTSVTSTIVALGQASDQNEFRRAFAAATVHDMFNFLTVAIFLPLEAATNFLYHISTGIVNSYDSLVSAEKPPDILKAVTKPFTKLFMQIDSKLINKIAAETDPDKIAELQAKSFLKTPYDVCTPDKIAGEWACSGHDACDNVTAVANTTVWSNGFSENCAAAHEDCEFMDSCDPEKDSLHYLFEGMVGSWSDEAAGLLMLVLALTILCTCLYLIVLILRSILKGRVAVWLHAVVNGNVPDIRCTSVTRASNEDGCTTVVPMGWVSGYLAMFAGFGLTLAVQSSSITTSALTPLVGVGVIKLERMYPTVLGANIGTTVTGILAALAADGSKLQYTLAVAFSHLFFNVFGITIWYVIWPLRPLPIAMARALGDVTAKYRWFPVAYIIIMFFLIPALFVALSLASDVLVVTVACVLFIAIIFISTVNYFQDNDPAELPACLQSWGCLPLWMRSLEPLDKLCCDRLTKCCCKKAIANQVEHDAKAAAAKANASGSKLKTAADRLEAGAEDAAEETLALVV